MKHEVIYRQKDQGKGYPKMGSPADLRPGDYLTFLIGQASHTRVVHSLHKSCVMVRPVTLDSGGQTIQLHKGRKVYFKDIVLATRLMTAEDYEAHLYLLRNPAPLRSPVPPPVAVAPLARAPKPLLPKTKPGKKIAPTQADVMDLWAMLNET